MRLVLSYKKFISASLSLISSAQGGEELTDPGAALLRPPIPPAVASILFNLSILGRM
jgi:hypothetical protein